MGIFDKAKKAINDNAEKIDDAVDKAAKVVDDKTGGKYADKVDKVQDTIKGKTGNL